MNGRNWNSCFFLVGYCGEKRKSLLNFGLFSERVVGKRDWDQLTHTCKPLHAISDERGDRNWRGGKTNESVNGDSRDKSDKSDETLAGYQELEMVAPGWWGCLESWSAGMAQTPSQGIWGRGAALHMLTAAFSCCIRLFVGDVLLVIQSLIVTYIYYYIFDTLQLRLLPIQYFWLWNLAPLCLTPRPMVRHIKATCLRLAVGEGKVSKYFDDSPSGQLIVREAAKTKTFFLGDLSQMWVGGVADSQTRSKPFKNPSNHPENRLFRPKFHLSFSQISQKPWGG